MEELLKSADTKWILEYDTMIKKGSGTIKVYDCLYNTVFISWLQ